MSGEACDYAEKAYRACLDGASGVQEHAFGFLRSRLAKDSAFLSDLGKCKTPVEAFNCQAAYAGDVVADFVDESVRMGTLLGDVARERALDAGSAPAKASRRVTGRGRR
jgi:hypothetical protein